MSKRKHSNDAGNGEKKAHKAPEDDAKYPWSTPNALVHFDIPVRDMERAKKFYGDVFGWTFQAYKDNYTMYSAGSQKCLSGGMYKFDGEFAKEPGFIMYIGTVDIQEAINKVFEHGGAIVRNSHWIDSKSAEHGACATYRDPEGNFFGLWAKSSPKDVETGELSQTVFFKAKPAAIYKKLTDAKQFADWSANKAEISNEVGGYCRLFDGWAEARNLELVENSRIVQSWRSTTMPKAHFTRVEIDLHAKRGGTELVLKHSDLPKSEVEDYAKGWHEFYWNKMGAEKKGK